MLVNNLVKLLRFCLSFSIFSCINFGVFHVINGSVDIYCLTLELYKFVTKAFQSFYHLVVGILSIRG